MKKILVSMFLLVFCLCLVGCENIGNNKLLRNQAGYEWLDDINIENIEKVQIEFGDGMTYIGNTRSIYSSIETEVIKDVFDYWYNCEVEQYSQDNEGVMDAGSEHTKFYLKTGEVKEITIIGMYLKDSNGIDFKVKDSYMINESKFLRTYKFVTDEEYGKLYEDTPTMEYSYIGDVPMKEIEFMEMMDEIDLEGVVSQYYIETNFGKIHFLLDVYFWVERTEFSSGNDGKIYYQLYGTSIYDLAEKYMNSNGEGIYELTIQNQTEYELIGIKNEYKAYEEVEVKMIYVDDVCTFAFLDGELLGVLTGFDSIKFNMPAKDSVLTISYSEEIYKVNVIDNFDLIEEVLNDYYAPAETIIFHVSHELYDNITVTINGEEEEGIDPLIGINNFKTYLVRMSEGECEIKVTVNGLSDYSCNDNLHHYEEEIKKVDNSYIKESTCKLCGEIVQEEITKIKLDTTILYFGSYSDDDSFELFVKEYNLSNRKYLIIDNVEAYYEIYPNIPLMNKELLSEEEADEFFKNNIMVLHIRYISGTLDFVPVNYYYNTVLNNIIMEYINDVSGAYITQFLGNTLDIITIPKEYYNKIVE